MFKMEISVTACLGVQEISPNTTLSQTIHCMKYMNKGVGVYKLSPLYDYFPLQLPRVVIILVIKCAFIFQIKFYFLNKPHNDILLPLQGK